MERFIISLGVCSLTMTVVAFVCFLLSKTLKNIQAPKWRYYLWILVFIGFITPIKPVFREAAVTIDIRRTTEDSIFGAAGNQYFEIPRFYILPYLLFLVWLAGFIAVLGIAFFKQRSFIVSVKRLAAPVSADILEKADRLMVEMCVASDVKLITVKEIASPMVVGVFKPLLILPDRSFSDEELYLILKHELVHLKRRDLIIKAFTLFCGAVHWFNPFIRFFIRLCEQECELYCDESVMKNESAELKKLYCQSILNTVSAESKINGRLTPALSSNFYFNKHGLKHRIKMIISFDKKYKLGIICALAAIMIYITGTVVAFSPDLRTDMNEESVETTTLITFTEVSEGGVFYNSAQTEISFVGQLSAQEAAISATMIEVFDFSQ